MIIDEGFWGMTAEVMEEVEAELKVFAAWEAHELAQFSDGKYFLIAGVGDPIEATDEFDVAEAIFLLKGYHRSLILRLVRLSEDGCSW